MDRQEAALAQWLAEHPDYTLAEALVDAGVSAGKGRHRTKGALAKFIQGGRDGTVPPGSCLVVESWSRFSREVATASLRTLLNDVWGQGLAISFCTDGVILTSELIDREDHRLHALLGAMGQARREYEERQRRSKGAAVKRRQLQDAGQVTPGRIPWWLQREADGSLALDPVGTETVRQMVALAIAGRGQNLVAREMQAQGRLAPKGGTVWSAAMARNTLDHPALSGDLVRRDKTLPGYYPAAISKAEHEQLRAATALLTEKHQTTGSRVHGRNLFQGTAFCAHCGGPLARLRPNPRSRAGHPGYIRCLRSTRGVKDADGNRCPGGTGSVQLDGWEAHCLVRLDKAVWTELLHRPADAERLRELQQQHRDAEQAADQAAAVLQRLEAKAEETWAAGGDDELIATATRAVSKAREKAGFARAAADATRKELAALQALPQPAEQAVELQREVKAFMRGLPTATAEERVGFGRWLMSRQPAIRLLLNIQERSCGLQVGDQQPVWERLNPALDLAALEVGMLGSESFEFEADEETSALLRRLDRGDGVLDLSEPLQKEFGGSGKVLASELG